MCLYNLCLVIKKNFTNQKSTKKIRDPGGQINSGVLDELPGRRVVALRGPSLPSPSTLPPTFLLFPLTNVVGEGKAGRKGGRREAEGRRQPAVGRLKAPVREKEQTPGMSGRSRTVKRAAPHIWLEDPC